MKKTKRIVALLLAAVLAVGCLGFAAYAADGDDLPTVVFDAQTKEFRFENCGENGTDLFRDFKNAMPGDNLVQHIRVKVENAGLDTVKIMLRSGESNADYATLLGMKVTYDKETNEPTWEVDPTIEHPATLTAVIPKLSGETITVTEWFKDKIKGVLNLKDQTIDPYLYSGTLAEGVYLGAYSESSQQDITVTLAIPKSAGNELQGLTATVDWIFTAEVIPYNPPTPDIPDEPTPSLDTVNHYAYIIGRKDGLVHPEAPITRAEVATIFFRMLTDESRNEYWSTSNPYPDIAPNDWCNNAISTMTKAGVIQGYTDGYFRPRASITRAEFAAIAVRFFQVVYEGEDLFKDIDEHWARDYINRAGYANIIQGYEDGTFHPDRNISRAEAVTIVNRVLGRKPDKDNLLPNMITWPDNLDEDAWYYADMQEATNSHEYDMLGEGDEEYESWTEIKPVRDWAAFEKEWADANAAVNPGEVVTGTPAGQKDGQ